LRQQVFHDDAARGRLEQIVHPRVRDALDKARRDASGPYTILVVPLLVEGGLHRMMDRVLVVDVPEETQIGRLTERDGIDRELALQMIHAQASREARLNAADDVFLNVGGMQAISESVEKLHNAYLALAEHGAEHVKPLHLPAAGE
jgi:dephospho-CoA kinase